VIKPPSIIAKEFPLVYSGDPALDLPPFAPDAAGDDEKKSALKARLHAFKVACETGDWAAITKPGESPTVFYFTPTPGLGLDYFESTAANAARAKKPLSAQEMGALVFRIALRRVENLGKLKVDFEEVDGYRLVSATFVEALYQFGQIGRDLVSELGAAAFEHIRSALSPL